MNTLTVLIAGHECMTLMSKWNQVYLYKPEILPLFLQLLSWYPEISKTIMS